MSTTATLAPSLANNSDTARPIPLPPPETLTLPLHGDSKPSAKEMPAAAAALELLLLSSGVL